MKKILSLLLLAFFLCTTTAWAATFIRGTVKYGSTEGKLNRIRIPLTATTTAGTATFTTYVLDPASFTNVHSLTGITGWYPYSIEINPASTGPTNGAWDLDITDAEGSLISQNHMDDLSSSATTIYYFGSHIYPQIWDSWTFSVGDNATNDAGFTAYVVFVSN